MSDAKRRAQERLEAMVDAAADVVESDVNGTMPYLRGSTRVLSAWRALEHVLGSSAAEQQPEHSADGSTATDDLAERREALKQALRTRRADPSR